MISGADSQHDFVLDRFPTVVTPPPPDPLSQEKEKKKEGYAVRPPLKIPIFFSRGPRCASSTLVASECSGHEIPRLESAARRTKFGDSRRFVLSSFGRTTAYVTRGHLLCFFFFFFLLLILFVSHHTKKEGIRDRKESRGWFCLFTWCIVQVKRSGKETLSLKRKRRCLLPSPSPFSLPSPADCVHVRGTDFGEYSDQINGAHGGGVLL